MMLALLLLLACAPKEPVAVVPAPAPAAQAVPADLLAGCPTHELEFAVVSLALAIDVGAPLYNDGDHAGCYRMYLGTAADVTSQIASCPGVRERLVQAMRESGQQGNYTDRAWTMRRGFDDVLAAWEAANRKGG